MRPSLLALAASVCLAILSHSQEFEVAPIPDWVDPTAVDLSPGDSPNPTPYGIEELLYGSQTRLGETVQSYREGAWRIAETQGLEQGSRLMIEWDPAYTTLTVHALEVIRNGEAQDRLDPERAQVLQREEGLDTNLLDGAKQFLLVLEDVRVGDVVRYAYTRTGSNPALDGHYVGLVWTRRSSTTRLIRDRITCRKDRPFTAHDVSTVLGAPPQPTITQDGEFITYEWVSRDTALESLPDVLPSWHSIYPWVQLSTFESWNEVARWGKALMDPDREVASVVRDKARMLASGPDAELSELIDLAIRFVRDEVRYLGIELGEGAYEAARPEDVLTRRFGDCKDKSLLLVQLLRELRVEANVCLVSSVWRRTLANVHPSAIFDHAIVRFEFEGDTYWTDPTESFVGGSFVDYVIPNYELGLVLDDETTDLEEIASKHVDPPTEVLYEIDARDPGSPGTLQVTTTYQGGSANRARANYAWTTPTEYAEGCLEYYQAIYEGATQSGELEFSDDVSRNLIVTQESYRLPDLWWESEEDHYATLFPLEIDRLLPDISDGPHVHPIALDHPSHVELAIRVKVDPDFSIADEDERLDNPAFLYLYTCDFEPALDGSHAELELTFSYESKSDHVLPADIRDVIDDVERAEETMEFSLWVPATSLSDVLGFGIAGLASLLLFGLLLSVVLIRSASLRRGKSLQEQVEDVEQESPWLTIWARPSATICALVNSRPEYMVFPLAILGGVASGYDNAMGRSLADMMSLSSVHAMAIIGGGIGGVIGCLLFSWVIAAIGRAFGGQAYAADIRVAWSWSNLPSLVASLLLIPLVVTHGITMFQEDTFLVDSSVTEMTVTLTTMFFISLCFLWSKFLLIKGVAALHGFGFFKALGVCLLGFLATSLLALPCLLPALAR